jgi:hypothetical protein
VIGTVLGAQLTFGLVAKPIAETLTSADFHSESVTTFLLRAPLLGVDAVTLVTNALTADVPPPDEGSAPRWRVRTPPWDIALGHRRSRGPYDRGSPDRQIGAMPRCFDVLAGMTVLVAFEVTAPVRVP